MSSSETTQNLPTQTPSENSASEQPVSQARIDANRRNALRSTGPKSARGKSIASRNSLKHGLLAKSVVITQGPAKENQAEFAKLLRGLQNYFAPIGMAEELLVQEIAVSYWMERRAQLFENAEIRKQARDAGNVKRGYKRRYNNDCWMGLEEVENVLRLVEQVRSEVETKNTVPAALQEQMAGICGEYWEHLTESKPAVLARLDKEKENLMRLKELLEQLEADHRALELQSALLLHPLKLEVLQRYNVASERRRYRAVAQLERLQRQRSGETIPAPIDVQVTGVADDFAKRSQ